VPEGRQLFPQMSVTENLELGGWLVPKAERAHRLERAFADFPKLKERATQLAGTMSGGEQQMVAVARAHDVRAAPADARRTLAGPRAQDGRRAARHRAPHRRRRHHRADGGAEREEGARPWPTAAMCWSAARWSRVGQRSCSRAPPSSREAYLGADKDPATGTTSASDAVQRRKAVVTTT
jgi:branched-chain amino acid transport system ATP-binding protein